MHFNSSQSRSAWTEQEDDLLRNAVGIYGERSWANVAQMVPGRSSKSCSDRWRNFLSPDIEHPRKSPFTEWEIAVVVLAQSRYGNNWKAISMLLPGRTNRAVKNLFVGNLKWGARLPEIRNRFLEWNMTLESLLEIKPDRAGGPVKPRPGQILPDGTSQDGSPLSGSPASTSSAGSAWQSDMTDHPNGSPGSANTPDRRRRAEGDMSTTPAAQQQSSPVPKRRRGAQSPVLGGLQPHMPSASLAPHPGALGPNFNGVSGTGSPALGMALPGAMGPPANRTPASFMGMEPSGALAAPKQPLGSSNGSNDSSGLTMPAGNEATPTSADLAAADGCGSSLTPVMAGLAGIPAGCFTDGGAGALSILQQPGGPRTHSMPCGGLQQLLMSGDNGMAARVPSWHYPGQMFGGHGGHGCGGIMDPSAAVAGQRPESPFQQPSAQMTAVTAAGNLHGSLTSLLTDGGDNAAAAAAGAAGAQTPPPVIKTEVVLSPSSYQMQHQAHWMHQQHVGYQQHQHMHPHMGMHAQQPLPQQQQQMGCSKVQQEEAAPPLEPAALQPSSLPQPTQPQATQQPLSTHQDVKDATTTAAVVASAAMDLPMPSSPVITGGLLTDMRSNDSAGLHSMLDQILNEDLADGPLTLCSSEGIPMPPHRSSAFDPPVISLPNAPDVPMAAADATTHSPMPHAPPPTPQGGVKQDPRGPLFAGVFGSGHGISSGSVAVKPPWAQEYLSPRGQSLTQAQVPNTGPGVNPAVINPDMIKMEPLVQANQEGMLLQGGDAAAASPSAAAAQMSPQRALQHQHQHHQQQQQQQLGGVLHGCLLQRGASTEQADSAAAAAAAGTLHRVVTSTPAVPTPTVSPRAALPPDSDLVIQLQQENMLLLHRLAQMEAQASKQPGGQQQGQGPEAASAVSTPADTAGAAAAAPRVAAVLSPQPGAAAPQGTAVVVPPAAAAAAASPAASAAQQLPAAVPRFLPGFEVGSLMPQLRPVLTRVGGSTGGALGGSQDLGAVMGGLGMSVDSPAQLINTSFLDESPELLDSL